MVDENVYLLTSPPGQVPGNVILARDPAEMNAPPPPVVSPVLTVICQHCRCIQMFGAQAMGLFAPAQQEAANG